MSAGWTEVIVLAPGACVQEVNAAGTSCTDSDVRVIAPPEFPLQSSIKLVILWINVDDIAVWHNSPAVPAWPPSLASGRQYVTSATHPPQSDSAVSWSFGENSLGLVPPPCQVNTAGPGGVAHPLPCISIVVV